MTMLPFHVLNIDYIHVWFENHTTLALFLVAVITAAESVPVVGLFVPGTAFIVVILSLLSLGIFSFWPLFFAMTLGAIAGDALGYHLGYHYKDWLHDHMRKRIPEKSWLRAQVIVRNQGVWAVGVSRFIPVLRAFVPALVGIGQMPMKRFYIANVISAIAWVFLHLTAGEVFYYLILAIRWAYGSI